MSISYQQQAKLLFQHKQLSDNLELQRKQKLLRMPINGVPFHKIVEEFCSKQIELKSDYDSEVISRLLQLQSKSRKEIQALQKAFGNLKFFMEAHEYLAQKEFQGLLQEIQYEKFDKYQTVFDFDELGYKYYIILKGSVFVQIPNKNFKKYEEKGRFALDLRLSSRNAANNGQNSKTSSRKNSSDSSLSSNSSNDSLKQLQSPSKMNQPSIKITKAKSSMKNELKNYFQFQEQGAKNKNKDEVQKTNNPNARKSVILAINTIKQVNKFASKLKHESGKEKSMFSHLKLSARQSKMNLGSCQNIDEDEGTTSATQLEIDPKEKIAAMYPQFDIVRELGAGEAFGEIALINNARRTASIICKEETTFAVLSKQSYDKILSQYHQAEQEKNISFLREFTIFNQLGKSKLDALFRIMEKQEFKRNQVIYSEGDPGKYVYFIRDGEIEVSQQCVKVNDIKHNPELQADPEYEKMMSNYNLKWKGQQQKESVKRIKIAILGENNYFGQEEIISNIPRLYRAQIFSTTAVLYCLPKQKFLSTVKLFSYSMDTMQKELSKRATWRINQLEKNLTTSRKIDNEIQKVQDEMVKLEFAEQTLKSKPEVVTQFIGSELDAMQKEHLKQDYLKYGIIRSEKDVNKLNEEIINQLKGKKKSKQQIKPGESKVKLFKLTLKNNLFQEETDKINQRMKKKIMSPREFKQFLVQSSQKFININFNGRERDEMVKEVLNAIEQKQQHSAAIQQEEQSSYARFQSFQQFPLDHNHPSSIANISQVNPKDQQNTQNSKKNKSMMVINSIHNDLQQSYQNIRSMSDIFQTKKGIVGSKFIQYDVCTPQNNKQQDEEQEIKEPSHSILNDKQQENKAAQIDQVIQDEKAIQDNLSNRETYPITKSNNLMKYPKRIQSAHPKIGCSSTSTNANTNTNTSQQQKYIIFPVKSPQKKQQLQEKISSYSLNNITSQHQQMIDSKDDHKSLNQFQAIQEEEDVYYPKQQQQQQQLLSHRQTVNPFQTFLNHKNENNHTIKSDTPKSNSLSPQRKQAAQSPDQTISTKQINQSTKVLLNHSNTTTISHAAPGSSKLFKQSSTISANAQLKNKIFNGAKSKSICIFEMPKQNMILSNDQKINNTLNQFNQGTTQSQSNQMKQSEMESSQIQKYKIQQNQQLKIDQTQGITKDEQNKDRGLKESSFVSPYLAALTNPSSNQLDKSDYLQQNNFHQQRIQSVPLLVNEPHQIKSKAQLNQFEITHAFNSSDNALPDQKHKHQRPQSSLVGSSLNTLKKQHMIGINSLARVYQFQGQSLSNLCSPISHKEGKQGLDNFVPMSSNNSRHKISLLDTPKNPSEFKADSHQSIPKFHFPQTYQQPNVSNSQTQINLNGFSQFDLQQLQQNRSQLVSPQNTFSNRISLPRSYKKVNSNQTNDKHESKNIHMDKLRFLKKDLDIKDPFKNQSKQFKKLMSSSTQFLSSPQGQMSPKGQSYFKLE